MHDSSFDFIPSNGQHGSGNNILINACISNMKLIYLNIAVTFTFLFLKAITFVNRVPVELLIVFTNDDKVYVQKKKKMLRLKPLL